MSRSPSVVEKARKPLQRTGRIKRQSRIVPKKRTPSEFARIYHSKVRVKWVKEQPCVACSWHVRFANTDASDNAHIPSRSGMSRKGDYTTIIPLCRTAFPIHYVVDGKRLAVANGCHPVA